MPFSAVTVTGIATPSVAVVIEAKVGTIVAPSVIEPVRTRLFKSVP